MPIDLPHEVAFALNMMGVAWPDVNEDDVRALATHVRHFAHNVASTHESATGTITDMGSVYSGYSYSALLANWGRMSRTHMADLDQACRMVADALDMAANTISVIKVVVLAEIAALVTAYFAVLATPGGGAMAPVVSMAARRICNQMEQSVVAYILAEVVAKALEPFEQAIDDMISGLAYNTAADFLDVPDASAKQTMYIEPDEVLKYAEILDAHADDIMSHAITFSEAVAALDFTTHDPFGTAPVAVTDTSRPTSYLPRDLPLLNVPALTSMLVDGQIERRSPVEFDESGTQRDISTGAGERSSDPRYDALPADVAGAAAGGVPSSGVQTQAPTDESLFAPGAPAEGVPVPRVPAGENGVGSDLTSPAVAATSSTAPERVEPVARDERVEAHDMPVIVGTGALTPHVMVGLQQPPIGDPAGVSRGPGAGENPASPAAQQSPMQQAGPRGAAAGGTPWARPTQTPRAAKAEPAKPTPVPAWVDTESGRTPWSKPERAPEKVAKVFAPTTSGAEGRHVVAKAEAPEQPDTPEKSTAEGVLPSAPPARPAVVAPDRDRGRA